MTKIAVIGPKEIVEKFVAHLTAVSTVDTSETFETFETFDSTGADLHITTRKFVDNAQLYKTVYLVDDMTIFLNYNLARLPSETKVYFVFWSGEVIAKYCGNRCQTYLDYGGAALLGNMSHLLSGILTKTNDFRDKVECERGYRKFLPNDLSIESLEK